MMNKRVVAVACGVVLAGGVAGISRANDVGPADVPVYGAETARGSMGFEAATVADPPATTRTVDGQVDDWVGESPRFGGTVVHSFGEVVYQDHLFDAYGADDGRDVERIEQLMPVVEAAPGTYRVEQMFKYMLGELGLPMADEEEYGNVGRRDDADIAEVRIAPDGEDIRLLVRFTNMAAGTPLPAVLVLADTTAGDGTPVDVGFGSNLLTADGDVAVLLADGVAATRDLATGDLAGVPDGGSAEPVVAVEPSGWTNAVEARLPRSLLERADGTLKLAVAAGIHDGSGGLAVLGENPDVARVANVAFRLEEPVRSFFEMHQALALWGGSVDEFFVEVGVSLDPAVTKRPVPGPGYHDRIFHSADTVARESGRDGRWQHYGVYLPEGHDPSVATPLQLWLHWRGGTAHTAAGVIPDMFRQLGDDLGSIVVSPSGRGTSTWYVGRGHVDVNEVWADVHETFVVDPARRYVTGHSMGGWGSWLLPILYPDRFAASMPYAGPVTQGAWTGLDFEGCEEYQAGEYTPCYIEANDSRPRDQHTRRLLENLRHVPVAIFHGAADELVPVSGVTRQVERMIELGYRHRYYLSPTYEHYTHPVMDQWAEGGRYLHQFSAPQKPGRVTYVRDMAFERATEEVQAGGAVLDFSFDSAYWMSGLTPADGENGVARFDGRSLAIAEPPYVVAPDSAPPVAPDQWGPFLVSGLQWLGDPLGAAAALSNGFSVTLHGAAAVTLDLPAMLVDPLQQVAGTVATDAPLSLRLRGGWSAPPVVTVDDQPVTVDFDGDTVEIPIPPGAHVVRVG